MLLNKFELELELELPVKTFSLLKTKYRCLILNQQIFTLTHFINSPGSPILSNKLNVKIHVCLDRNPKYGPVLFRTTLPEH